MADDTKLRGAYYDVQGETGKQTLRGKDKQLDSVLATAEADAEANDIVDMGGDHRSVVAHFGFPGDSHSEEKSRFGLRKSTRCMQQVCNTQESEESTSPLEGRYIELEQTLMKSQGAASQTSERNTPRQKRQQRRVHELTWRRKHARLDPEQQQNRKTSQRSKGQQLQRKIATKNDGSEATEKMDSKDDDIKALISRKEEP